MPSSNPDHQETTLVINREFSVPKQQVFDALSHPEALSIWWGPVGYTMTITIFEFKPGGLCLFKMENEESSMWARFIYGEIKQPDLVEFTLSFSDEKGELKEAPFFENWPLKIHNSIRLIETNGVTRLTLHCQPDDASQLELDSFKENKSSFLQGLTAALNKLSQHLATN